jgi:hypothetical protein
LWWLDTYFFISFLDNVYFRAPINGIFYASNLRLPLQTSRVRLENDWNVLNGLNG